MASFYSRSNDLITIITDDVVTFLAFLAGSTIRSNNKSVRVSMMDTSWKKALKSFGFGIILSIPLSLFNFLYFAYNHGKINWQNPLVSALQALQPGIGEEIIFRFFIINILYELLKDKLSQKPLIISILAISVIPHSLLHYPDLWLTNISGAIFMMVLTCILFGLPMAYLQCKRDIETSIGFHWFIDPLRAFGGFF
jgi:membrane protease YdiL (CAAX protease family)